MPQTSEGALKISAKHAGISTEEYRARLARGEYRCTRCKIWKHRSCFGNDRSRPDGRDRSCFDCRRVKVRQSRKGQPSAFKGRKHTDAAKVAIGAASKGRRTRLGIRHTPEARQKMSESHRARARTGPDAPGYIDGKGVERRGERMLPEYKQWRRTVFARDGFSCVHCGDDRGGNLHAHHILPFATHPALRCDPKNGVTLCEPCHEVVHRFNLSLWSYGCL